MQIENAAIVVTGAAGGIGRALAREFHHRGARRVVVADLDGQGAEAVAAELDAKRPGSAFGLGVDISSEAGNVELIRSARDVCDGTIDLFFANAVFQWLPEHMTIFERLMGHLRPGGVLAAQMPDNLDEPSHRAMRDTAADGPWAFRFAEPAVRRTVLPAPSVYYDRLKPHAARIDIWHTIYNHPMADHGAIVEWVKGSGLRPWLDRAGPDHRDGFLAAYRRRIEEAYPVLAGGGVLFRFPRLFIVAAR